MDGPTQYTHDLFVSYAEADRAWVEGYLLDALTRAGVRYHTEAAFALGAPRLLEFERAVQTSRRTLLILSSAYLIKGSNQFPELLAQFYGVETGTWPVIPLILNPGLKLPTRLAMLVPVDASDPANWPKVIEHLCAKLQRPAPGPAPAPLCPYPGMAPFGEADSGRFFGREHEVQELLELLRLRRLAVVIGPSGSGKSSLVFAGLIPALRRSSLFPVNAGGWIVRAMRPGSAPLAALQDAVGDRVNPTSLTRKGTPGQRLLLVVDQLEEMFTLGSAEALPFQEKLLRLRNLPDVYLVLTVRADFYPDLMAAHLWSQIQAHRFEILPLDEHGLREAIVRPAESVQVYVEAALVERLVADAAGEPGVLPLVQETLLLLWEKVDRRLLPLRAYEALVLPRRVYGGPPLTGLQVAMARRADAALAELAPQEQVTVRRILLRLIQFGEGRADTRRQQPVTSLRAASDDPAMFDRTLQHLADRRLITLSGEAKEENRKADIAHEALITGWPALQGWLSERREAELTRRRLEVKAAEWERLGQSIGGLLDLVELLEVERWLSGPDAAELGYGPALPALARASREAIEEAERQREAARRRELELERQRAEAERRRAEEQVAAANSLRRQAMALAFVLMAAVAATVIAVWQLRENQRQTRVALRQLSRVLAAQASASTAEQLDRALLLSLEALRASDTPEARASLLAGLVQSSRPTAFQVGAFLENPGRAVTALALSPDGRILALGGDDGTIAFWDAITRRPLGSRIAAHKAEVNSIAFSPDGLTLASASCGAPQSYDCSEGEIRLWDVATRQARGPALIGHRDWINSVAFSSDGKILASGSDDGTIILWDPTTRQPLDSPLAGNGGWILKLAFSPKCVGEPKVSAKPCTLVLAAGNQDGSITLWDVAAGRPFAPSLKGHTDEVWGIDFSPDGRLLASSSSDKTIRLWDVPSGQPLGEPLRGHTDKVWAVDFSPDGRLLASASNDKEVRLWNVATGQPLDEPLKGHSGAVFGVVFGPDGRLLVTGGDDGRAILWDAKGDEWLGRPVVRHASPVNAMALSPDGHIVALAQDDRSATLWDSASGQALASLTGHTGPVVAVAFSPDGKLLASAGADQAIIIWDVATRQLAGRPLTGHTAPVMRVTFSPDGKLLASGSCGLNKGEGCLQGEVRLWNAVSREPLATLGGHKGLVASITFSPDGKVLASGGQDGQVILWDVAKRQMLGHPLDGHKLLVGSLAFSPDGKLLASGGDDRQLLLWDVNKGFQAINLLGRQAAPVLSTAFSRDGAMLASGNGDGTLTLWDVADRQQAGVLAGGHTVEVWSVVFSPDGKTLFSSDADRTIAWNVDVAAWREHACRIANRSLTAVEWAQFIGPEVQYRLTCPALPPGQSAQEVTRQPISP